MILFVFEGNQREPALFHTIQRLFFPKDNQHIVCSFGNNLYQLYKELNEYDGDGDFVSLLKERFSDRSDNPFKDIERSSDFSEVYLFFDYDFQNKNLPLDELNKQLDGVLTKKDFLFIINMLSRVAVSFSLPFRVLTVSIVLLRAYFC